MQCDTRCCIVIGQFKQCESSFFEPCNKPRPDSLLLLTFLTQMKDALNQPHRPDQTYAPQTANAKKSKSPKRSLEKNLSKLAESLKRRSLPKSKQQPPSSPPPPVSASTASDVKCPFCERTVYVAERYGQDGFWFHRKCFRCHKCQELIIGPNFANIANSYKGNGIIFDTDFFRQKFFSSTLRIFTLFRATGN